MRKAFGKVFDIRGIYPPIKEGVKTKLKLFSARFEIWTNEIYLLPTIRILYNNPQYHRKTLEIFFHFLCFNIRLFLVERETNS